VNLFKFALSMADNDSSASEFRIPTVDLEQSSDSLPVKEKKERKPRGTKPHVAKRHLKRVIATDIRKPAIRRLGRRGGVESFSSSFYPEVRNLAQAFLDKIIKDCVITVEMKRKNTISLKDVSYAFKKNGRPFYIATQ